MGNLSNIPVEILLDILTRLPTESVLECKLVCKPWRSLVSHHPSFSQMQLTHLLNNHHDPASKLSFLSLTEFDEHEHQLLNYFEYSENHDEIPIDSIRRVDLTSPFDKGYRIIGSQNGLIGLETHAIFSDHSACIYNPITKEYVFLPESNRRPRNYYVCSGFGYLRETNEYKVVRVNYDLWDWEKYHLVCVEVCTLGSDNGWRSIGEYRLSFDQLNFLSEYGVFANETLYWNPYSENIVAFNLTDEKFYELPTLPCLSLACGGGVFSEVGILGGDLSYSLGASRGRINIWLLKTIGNQNMMEQEEYLSLPGSEEFVRNCNRLQPLALMSSGEVLFFSRTTHTRLHTSHTHLHSYDIKSSSWRTIVNFPQRVCQIIPHMNTLISPKALLREVDMNTVVYGESEISFERRISASRRRSNRQEGPSVYAELLNWRERFRGNTDFVCVEICTLGTGNGWRNAGEYRLSFSEHTFHYDYAVFANGTLYWIQLYGKSVAFNLVDEQFYELPTLPCDFHRIGILGDDLCCFKNDSRARKASIWLLKKIVNQNMVEQEEYLSLTWSEEFVGYHLQPLALMNTGHEVLFSSGTHLYSYDIRSSCLRTIVDFPPCVCQTIPHMNTFISLKALGEDDPTTIE